MIGDIAMALKLGQAFHALVGTLHSEISKEHVEAFARHLNDVEDRLNRLEHRATDAGAQWVEGHVVPVLDTLAGETGASSSTGPTTPGQ